MPLAICAGAILSGLGSIEYLITMSADRLPRVTSMWGLFLVMLVVTSCVDDLLLAIINLCVVVVVVSR